MRSLLQNVLKKVIFIVGLLLITSSAYAQVTYTDSVCAGELDVVYGVSNAVSTSTYAWSLSDPAAGTIDATISGNNSTIEIDWSTTVGTYTLYVVETSVNGCIGDTVPLNIVVNPLPTATLAADSVCEGFNGTLTFDLTGTAPWYIAYTDGTTNFTDTANSTPFIVSLPAYTTSQAFNVTSLSDANGCAADPAALPSTNLVVFPKPSTGAIFHY